MKRLIIQRRELLENIEKLKDLANKRNTKVIGVVKANGYGLGLIEFANILIENGIQYLGVANKDEALALRTAGIKEDIIILSCTRIKEDIESLIENNITVSVGSKECAGIINELSKKYDNIKVHMKIDSGFGRYGFLSDKTEDILEAVNLLSSVEIEGIYAHFSLSYYKNSESTRKEYENFIKVINFLEFNNIIIKMKHICNSSAFLNFENMSLNAVRIGSAFLGRVNAEENIGLNRIAYIETNIVEVKNLPSGHNVGYLDAYVTKKETKMALIPFGYIDGFNVGTKYDMFRMKDKFREFIRAFKRFFKRETLYAYIKDKKYKIIGIIGVNHIAVDITDSDINIGDIVKLEINPLYIDKDIKRVYRD